MSGYSGAGGADKKQTADRIQPKLPVKLSAVCGRWGRWNPLPYSLCLCGVVLVCPVWPVARQVNDPAKKPILSTPLLPLLPVIARVQANWACKRERIIS